MYRFVAREESSFPVTVRKASRRPSAPSPLQRSIKEIEAPVESVEPEHSSVHLGPSDAPIVSDSVESTHETPESPKQVLIEEDAPPVNPHVDADGSVGAECSGGKCVNIFKSASDLDDKKRLEEFLPPTSGKPNNKNKGFKR